MTSTANLTASEAERKRRRRTAARISFAAVALLGIGAAATSAAWTDDAWFTATASGATVELQGSLDGTHWIDADTSDSGVAVEIPASTFADLGQAATKTVTIHIKNTSSVPLSVAEAITTSGDVFSGSTPATLDTDFSGPQTLAANAEKTIVVTVTTDGSWPTSYQGKTGAATIKYTGTQA